MSGSRSRVTRTLSTCFTRDSAGIITSVDASMTQVLGWSSDQLVGRPSTDFIHPEDQPSAVGAWFNMLAAPNDTRVWRGRYHSADGTWKWVETVNLNQLGDPSNPVVASTMTVITVDQVSAEEELRAREQLHSRLSDALPVGVFQIDRDRRITFTNDRFHTIVGCDPAATTEAQFANVVPEDQIRLDAVLSAVLGDETVDDIDIHLRPASKTKRPSDDRFCVLSMRPLTDSNGRVSGAIGCLSDITDRVQLRKQLELRASTDGLTACLNRATTLETLAATLSDRTRTGNPTAIMFIDIDQFKSVNDRLGHAAGDRLLEIVARRLRDGVRDGDQVGRIGGDEFLVICPGVDSSETAAKLSQRLNRAVTGTIDIADQLVELRASIGVAWTDQPVDADTFVAQADEAMYCSKQAH
jgi:diguanylate cyclase (GGDEF)-like protein/PAS domain S-box-containing protein